MKLARTIRLDESDDNVFESPASAGEWALAEALSFRIGAKTIYW